MCSISLEDALKKIGDPLTMDIDDYLNDKYNNQQYEYDRLKGKKKTCGRICGYNYVAWIRNRDSKKTYTNKIFDCHLCKQTSEGGRILIAGNRKVSICRRCHRKKTARHLQAMWEEHNREHRNAYRNQWAKDNPGKVRRQKRRARKKAGIPVYGAKTGKKWSYMYKACRMCNSTRLKHRGHGYCRTCYYVNKRAS